MQAIVVAPFAMNPEDNKESRGEQGGQAHKACSSTVNILHRRKTTIISQPPNPPRKRTPLPGARHHLVVLGPKRLQLAVVSIRVPAVAGDVHDQHRLVRACVRSGVHVQGRGRGRKSRGSVSKGDRHVYMVFARFLTSDVRGRQ